MVHFRLQHVIGLQIKMYFQPMKNVVKHYLLPYCSHGEHVSLKTSNDGLINLEILLPFDDDIDIVFFLYDLPWTPAGSMTGTRAFHTLLLQRFHSITLHKVSQTLDFATTF